ncbi:MAG: radical SAM protein [Candidatus Bathyarchaeota archaeon]|nr:MAG: radical SAM protein [Candidatus Bathyarchaeota archaeon]
MNVKEVTAKSILSKSKVLDYAINPYIGCEHGCTYCYARYMKRFTGHKEDWGKFVDIKINAPKLLQHEIRKKRVGRVWISGTCDPYQPMERHTQLTRRCLEILSKHGWPVTIQTKSTLIMRDLDLLGNFEDIEVGLSISTGNESIKALFEPKCPAIEDRIKAVESLHSAGLKTFVMIAPILPEAEILINRVKDKVDNIIIDKMNYHYADWVYKKHGLQYALTPAFFDKKKEELTATLGQAGISYQFLF